MTRLFADHTSAQIAATAGHATLLIPVGAIEQHGPHLPVSVDSLMAEHVALEAARRACESSDHRILVAPVLSFGSSHHHLPRSGTLSLRSSTLMAVLDDLLVSAVRGGFRSLVVLNGHGGNQDLVHQAVRDVVLRHHVRAAATSYWTPAWERLVGEARARGIGPVPGHAGSFETSLMLFLRPDLIDKALIPATPVAGEWSSAHPLSRPVIEEHGWVDKLGGYTDGATAASAEAGGVFVEETVEAVTAFLREFCSGQPEHDDPDQEEVKCGA